MNRFILLSIVFFMGCGQSREKIKPTVPETPKVTEKTLVEHVKLAINPRYQDWVLFENGTYVVFEQADTIADMEAEAIGLMKQYGPVYAGTPAGDFEVVYLHKTEGWVVSGHCEGMFTYVNPSELETQSPGELEIGLFGRSKREQDGQTPVVIHVNRKK